MLKEIDFGGENLLFTVNFSGGRGTPLIYLGRMKG